MTYEQILTSVQSLTADEQYVLANSILDRLALSGESSLSDALREEIRRRDIGLENNPNEGEPWDDVKKEVFGN